MKPFKLLASMWINLYYHSMHIVQTTRLVMCLVYSKMFTMLTKINQEWRLYSVHPHRDHLGNSLLHLNVAVTPQTLHAVRVVSITQKTSCKPHDLSAESLSFLIFITVYMEGLSKWELYLDPPWVVNCMLVRTCQRRYNRESRESRKKNWR